MDRSSKQTVRDKELRQTQTEAERLLWSLLRSKQLCNLKFRRQHPIEPFYVDFACEAHMVVVELDGEYHDAVTIEDLRRQRYLESLGWRVIRFMNDDVLQDVEAVARSIAKQMGFEFRFVKRNQTGSGIMSPNARNYPK